MLKTVIIFISLAYTFDSNAQYSEAAYTSTNNELNIVDFDINQELNTPNQAFSINEFTKSIKSIQKNSKMEKIGKTLTYVGVPLAILGGIMMSGADSFSYNCVNGDCEGNPRGAVGVLLLTAGIGMSITGAILWSKGKN